MVSRDLFFAICALTLLTTACRPQQAEGNVDNQTPLAQQAIRTAHPVAIGHGFEADTYETSVYRENKQLWVMFRDAKLASQYRGCATPFCIDIAVDDQGLMATGWRFER